MTDETLPVQPQFSAHSQQEGAYGAAQIQCPTDREHVRSRSGMYIGDTGSNGLHHLAFEAIDNSIDEVMAGYATDIDVVVHPDSSISVIDNGRGIPVEVHPQLGISTLEGVMTRLKMGGKFNDAAYKTSSGLHGIGVKAVNFMSQWCEVEVRRDGRVFRQTYERGVPQGSVAEVGTADSTGTKISFQPDHELFDGVTIEYNSLRRRLQELAYLNRGVRINFTDERNGQHETLEYHDGIVEFVRYLNRAFEPIHPDVIHIGGPYGEAILDIAFQYSTEYTSNIHCFVNNINTSMGGTHLTGFRTALTRTLNAYGKQEKLFKDAIPSGDDFREGLTAVISVRIPEPQFESQTKVKLNNPDLEGLVSVAVSEFLTKYLEEHPRLARAIVQKGVVAAEAKRAARKAKDLIRQRKTALGGGGLPGKLRDCISRNRDQCELYLVEGDSAGGSAEGGRMRDFQAILPLRGKIINAYKSREDKVLANEEVQSIIQAIGTGISTELDLAKRRYDKIIIMTDADVDGSHIRTLLLCFFYRQMYPLVAAGHLYIAQPPLYRVVQGKTKQYIQTDDAMRDQLLQRGLENSVLKTADGREFRGEQMRSLCQSLAGMEESIVAMERRGISLKAHAQRLDPVTGHLPSMRLAVGQQEHWFADLALMERFLQENQVELPDAGQDCGDTEVHSTVRAIDLPEIRSINLGLKSLQGLGFAVDDLVGRERTGASEPLFRLVRGDVTRELNEIRSLLGEVRAGGEKGLTLTRFKGLGEMNAAELRETTLDPANRTLIKVSLSDAGAADEMFRLLMGDRVEPRREFIEKHALEVRNLDV